jgi:hypothetical protein
MTKVDLIALGFVALTAFIGWKKGLLASALSVGGIVLGAWLGSRLAPSLLQGGRGSPYTPLARTRRRRCRRDPARDPRHAGGGRRCARASASRA